MNTPLSTILGFIAGVFLTVLTIYWFRAGFDLVSALLDRDLTSCGSELIIFGAGLCVGGVLIIVLIPHALSTVALFSLYGGILGGLACAGLGGYLMTREKRKGCEADRDP